MNKSIREWKQVIALMNTLNDVETEEHIERVGLYAEIFGKALECSNEFIEKIKEYASVHDIGKIGVCRTVLEKPGRLSPKEFEEVKKHVEIGYSIVNRLDMDRIAQNMVLYHHEKWDGKGYIYGLSGEEIPLEARIMSICDVYDALRQKRIYKDSFSHDIAKKIILGEKGKAFDPSLVKIFEENHKTFSEIYLGVQSS